MTSVMDIEEIMRKKLEPFGLLRIEKISREYCKIYVAHLITLTFILSDAIIVIIDKEGFRVSSGAIFDSRNVDDEVVHEFEKVISGVVKEKRLTIRKTADNFFMEKREDKLTDFEKTLQKVAEALRELNQRLSQNDIVRQESAYQKIRGIT